ncbi:unnamed protein product [Bursaphelenchus xylophilus]|uniref:(pine wood nematode) hypothetical protein n=1 Tax=Bursaphelenchus xylophilus TaxID=6326 RepID=A0A1I7RXM7_BURXY|nr:unnamed protein product [Bursaphelenchus xylophilus]CAG9126596.1 unnamed protein product [Bursaphelenchus xylophilus]
MKLLLLTAFLMPCISAVSGCKCKNTTNEEAYCEAKWISHLKVLEKKQSHDRLTTIYTVEHIDIFKKPDGDLPTEFISPSFSGSCGISALKPGEEYLLTGTIANGFELRAVSCLFFNVEGSNLLGAVEWKAVPASIKDLLSKNKPACSLGRESA